MYVHNVYEVCAKLMQSSPSFHKPNKPFLDYALSWLRSALGQLIKKINYNYIQVDSSVYNLIFQSFINS